jgi:hypothetical protein
LAHRLKREGFAVRIVRVVLVPIKQQENRSVWLSLKNRVFFGLWITGLVSGCMLAAKRRSCVTISGRTEARLRWASVSTGNGLINDDVSRILYSQSFAWSL